MENLSWDDLRVLLAVHRAGSLLGAGKVLGISTSTTARRLDALETALGRPLVHRGQAGTELKADALAMVRLAEALEYGLDAVRRDAEVLAGTLRITLPEGLAPAIARALLPFQLAHPRINLELIGESRMADVAAREADIAVRLVRSSSNVLVEKRLPPLRYGLFASAAYVHRHLPARRLDKGDAPLHAFVGLLERWKDLPHERWMRALGATRFVFQSSSMEAITEAVRHGAGLAAFATGDARAAEFLPVETSIAPPLQPCFLAYHRDLREQPHVRLAIAAIDAHFRRDAQIHAA